MSYTPTQWNTGDTITASALNKIEQGIANAGSGSGAVIVTDNETALDKTYAEIYDLVNGGTPCYIKFNVYGSVQDLDTDYAYHVRLMPIVGVLKYDDVYRVYATSDEWTVVSNLPYVGVSGVWTYQASASNAYPTFFRKTTIKAADVDLYSTRL